MFLYQQIIDYLILQINSGELLPGAKVPTEKELSEQFAVSRITSKKALDELAVQGLVTRTPGRGSYVVDTVDVAAMASMVSELKLWDDQEKPRVIGVIFPDIGDSYACNLLRHLEARATKENVLLIFKRSCHSQALEEQAIAQCLAAEVSGLIIFPAFGKFFSAQLLRLILDGFPVVILDREMIGVPTYFVGTDNRAAARLLIDNIPTDCLQSLLIISPPKANNTSLEARMAGLVEGLAERGVPVELDKCCLDLEMNITGMDDIGLATEQLGRLDARITKQQPLCIVALESKLALLAAHVCASTQNAQVNPRIYSFDDTGAIGNPLIAGCIVQDAVAIAQQAIIGILEQLRGLDKNVTLFLPAEYISRI